MLFLYLNTPLKSFWNKEKKNRTKEKGRVWRPETSENAKKTKKESNLEFAFVIDEQILRFEIAMEDTATVTVGKSSQKLKEEDLQESMITSESKNDYSLSFDCVNA